jgi:complex iron-sulfur molybdoenzyme family reductase subunit gamma
MVKAVKITSAANELLLDPDGDPWRAVEKQPVSMLATPLVSMPSEYMQNKWASLPYGEIPEVQVAAAHNGQAIFFRLEWDDPSDDSGINEMADFPDQCGVMLPINDDAVIAEMGMVANPVNMWLWRAGVETPLYVTAEGRGTSSYYADSPLSGKGAWREGRWRVVIARPFTLTNIPAKLMVPLAPGMKHKCTFAVWQGSNKERAGLKAYQPSWQPLEIEA